jgi:hypothetical protein
VAPDSGADADNTRRSKQTNYSHSAIRPILKRMVYDVQKLLGPGRARRWICRAAGKPQHSPVKTAIFDVAVGAATVAILLSSIYIYVRFRVP